MPVDVTPGAVLHTSAVRARENVVTAVHMLGVDVVDVVAAQATTPQTGTCVCVRVRGDYNNWQNSGCHKTQ